MSHLVQLPLFSPEDKMEHAFFQEIIGFVATVEQLIEHNKPAAYLLSFTHCDDKTRFVEMRTVLVPRPKEEGPSFIKASLFNGPLLQDKDNIPKSLIHTSLVTMATHGLFSLRSLKAQFKQLHNDSREKTSRFDMIVNKAGVLIVRDHGHLTTSAGTLIFHFAKGSALLAPRAESAHETMVQSQGLHDLCNAYFGLYASQHDLDITITAQDEN